MNNRRLNINTPELPSWTKSVYARTLTLEDLKSHHDRVSFTIGQDAKKIHDFIKKAEIIKDARTFYSEIIAAEKIATTDYALIKEIIPGALNETFTEKHFTKLPSQVNYRKTINAIETHISQEALTFEIDAITFIKKAYSTYADYCKIFQSDYLALAEAQISHVKDAHAETIRKLIDSIDVSYEINQTFINIMTTSITAVPAEELAEHYSMTPRLPFIAAYAELKKVIEIPFMQTLLSDLLKKTTNQEIAILMEDQNTISLKSLMLLYLSPVYSNLLSEIYQINLGYITHYNEEPSIDAACDLKIEQIIYQTGQHVTTVYHLILLNIAVEKLLRTS